MTGGGAGDAGTGGGGGGDTDAGTGVGGGGGDADAGTGGGGGSPTCDPSCPDWQECVGTACVDRYSGITLSSPPRTSSAFTVTGTLVLAPGRASATSPTLVVSATRDGGVESASFASQAGDSFATTPFPATEGGWVITVAWPDAGLSATASTTVDTSPPTLAFAIEPPPARVVDGGLDQRDPNAPDAFRRDERATIQVTWTAADLDPDSVVLRVGDRAWPADAGARTDAGLTFVAPLWEPTFNVFSGQLAVNASAADDLGNAGTSDGGALPITRLRWRRIVPGLRTTDDPIVTDAAGNLFVMTDGPTVESYSVEGLRRWSRPAAQPYLMGLALGTVPSSDGPLLYARELAIDGVTVSGEAFPADKGAAPVRPWISAASRTSSLGPVVLSNTATNDEGAFIAWVDASAKTAITWSSVVGTPQTSTRLPPASIAAVNGLEAFVADGTKLYVTGDNRVFGFNVASNLGFPEESTLGYPASQPAFTSLAGPIAVTSTGALTGFGVAGGLFRTWQTSYPAAGAGQQPQHTAQQSSPVVSGRTIWFSKSDTLPGPSFVGRVCRATVGGVASCSADNTENVLPSRVLGQGGRLYTGVVRNSTTRSVQERDAVSLAVRWEGPGPTTALSLVCGPSGQTGVLAGADGLSTTPRLVSVVVDARGLDATADWPMPSHDPRASRDAKSPLTPFQCP